MIGEPIANEVASNIEEFKNSRLAAILKAAGGPYVIKFVKSQWADTYRNQGRLKISAMPALTWGTATYVTPMLFPLSSALYGRIGLVTDFDPTGWRIFDATIPSARMAYTRWVRVQPAFSDLVLTVHSTQSNHYLRNKFRSDFKIDCVLFNPDQEADLHTDRINHAWMAVTDWTTNGIIDANMSNRLARARFTVLLDEDFSLENNGLPIQRAERQIEKVTEQIQPTLGQPITAARFNANLPTQIIQHYQNNGYVHLFINP